MQIGCSGHLAVHQFRVSFLTEHFEGCIWSDNPPGNIDEFLTCWRNNKNLKVQVHFT